jgi:glycosyltransferase involved in cell wall biosynthesis
MKYANVIISVSQQNAISCKEKYRRDILYIPNGVNIPNLISRKSNKEYWIFAASRIYDIKGLHLLLEAMKDNNITIQLKVVGNLGQRLSYQRKILSLSDGLDIEFIETIKDKDTLFQLLKNAKLFVFPSTTEAMSMMLLEVAALSVPIIASNIPANTSIFNNKEMLFFKSGDSNSLAKCLIFAKKNKKLLSQNAKNAFFRISTEYKWDIISEEYNKIFNQLVN